MNLNFNKTQQKSQNPEVEMTCGLEEMSDEKLLQINGGVTAQLKLTDSNENFGEPSLEFESNELNSVEAGVSARFGRLGLGL